MLRGQFLSRSRSLPKLIGSRARLHSSMRSRREFAPKYGSGPKPSSSKFPTDIGAMWKVLHPGEPIENVHLYMPDEDKAIDIALRFHGKDQDSPRLTLSEGYRNSLGLCIFLAL